MVKRAILAATLSVFAAGQTVTANEKLSKCDIKKFQLFIDARISWINDLNKLVVTTVPEMKHEANLIKNHDLLSIKARSMEFAYLSEHNPEKLHLEKPIHMWLNLDDSDKNAIAKVNEQYRQVHHDETLEKEDAIRLKALRQQTASKVLNTEAFADLAMGNKDALNAIKYYPCE